jgi:hypothetical protein
MRSQPRQPLPVLAAPPAGCSLSAAGLQAQRRRLAALANAAAAVEKRDDKLHLRFAATIDEQLVDEFVATEQACCPTLQISFDRQTRRLRIAAAQPEAIGLLDLFAAAFALAREGPISDQQPD